jgi:hypothetical protein
MLQTGRPVSMSTYIANGLGIASELSAKITGLIHPGPTEFMRSLPDSIFLGTSIFALLTQNFPLGILVFAMLEFSILSWLIAGLIGSVQDNKSSVTSAMCLPGIPSPYQISVLGHLYPQTTFPSIPILFVASTLFYIMSSIINFREELNELGQKESEWKIRIPLSIIFSTLLILSYSFWRVSTTCDSLMTALGSVGLGAVFGGIVYLIHVYLFGRDSINFLGLPLLADRAAGGRPLYVCAKQKVN